MDPRLARSWQRLASRRDRLLTPFTAWPADRLRQRPMPDAWSIIEVVEHLILTERAIFAGVRKNRGGGHAITLKDQVRNALVLGVMSVPMRVQVPPGAGFLQPTQPEQELAAFIASWDAERRQMADYLASLQGQDLTEGVFAHPRGGWTSVYGTLVFLESHLMHHGYQMRRICKVVGPGAPAS